MSKYSYYILIVPHLHLYVPEDVAQLLGERARREGVSLSCFLAGLAKREVESRWPDRYFDEVIGKWEGELARPSQLASQQWEPW